MIKVSRRATYEEGAFCSACNRFTSGALVRLVVRRQGYDDAATWLCAACLRHIAKAACMSNAGGEK